MTPASVLATAKRLGISLWVADGKLRYRAPAGGLNEEFASALRTHRDALIALLGRQATIPVVDRRRPPVASFAQERLWFLDRLNPGLQAYNMWSVQRLRGQLDEAALRRALDDLVRRHEVLRTTLADDDGRAVQVIAPPSGMTYARHDVSADGDPQTRARELVAEEVSRPFDLAKGPLVRAALVRLAESERVLVVVMHHVVGDEWSIDVMWREVWAAYAAFAAGIPSPLADLPLQYADYAVWHREWLLQADVLEPQLAFWNAHLAGAPSAIELPTDRPRPAVQSYRGGYVSFAVDAVTTARSKELGRRLGATPFMVLLSAFAALLSRQSGQRDLVIGTPIANRNRAETEGLIGFFVNTLALRVGLGAGTTFEELVRATKETALAAYAHQDVPFERVVEALGVPRDLSRAPVFQVMFAMQNVASDTERTRVGELEIGPFPPSDFVSPQFDLTLFVGEAGSSFEGRLEYNSDLFDRSTIERFAEQFVTLLRAATARPEESVARLPLMSDAEKRRVLVEWNDTRAEYASDKCIHELFEEQARRTPNAIAVEYEDARVTYAELNARANRLASWLREQGVALESAVGVLMDRSVEMVTALYAILKAGAAYVPLDPELPVARLETMIAQAGARVILAQPHTTGLLREPVVDVVRVMGELSTRPADDRPSGARRASRAYIIFTSGSTGTPKGVVNTHEGILNRLVWMQGAFRLTTEDCVLQKTPFTFDVSVWELFWPLMYGARLAVARPGEHRDPHALADAIRKHGVTTLHFVPSMLTAFLEEDESSTCASVRQVFCSGEALTPEQCRRFRERLSAELHNLYGPTEAAVDVTWWDCSKGPIPDRVPIGRPIANTQCFVLDERMNPVPIGVTGELHLGGIQLARGYVGRPDLTAERFVPSPFVDGARLYKTGDLVRFRADGALEYLGRIDHQVKVRGFRIELGEIEAALTSRAEVSAAVVVAREDTPGGKRLVAYLAGTKIDVAAVKTELGRTLPDYMVPSAFVVLDALPLTPSGKVDRRALPAPDFSALREEYVAPRSPVEESLAQVWREVLKLERAGVHDDFFALGGHSLLATQVVSRIRSALGVELPVRALFEAPTIAALAKRVEQARAQESASPPLVRRNHDARPAASFAQERLWFLDRLNPGSDAYNLPSVVRLRGPLDEPALRRALDELVRRHEVLRTTFAEVDGRPVQVIAPPSGMTFAKHDVSGDGDPDARARALVAQEVTHPFDLAKGPLVRAVLVRVAESEHVLLVAMHHVVSDAWSLDVVMWRELWDAYAAFASGRASPLADLPLQYADYAEWQREWLKGDALERQVAFWKTHLAGAPGAIDLPTDRARPAVQTFHGEYVPLAIDAETAARAKGLCRRLGATPFMVLLSAFAALLSRYSGQRDLVIGTPIANRNRAETESLIGFFVNTLPLRVGLETSTTFEELVRSTKETALAAYAHQDVPFERVVEVLGVPRDLSRTPVFQVMFAMQNVAGDEERRRVGDLEAKLVPPSVTVAKFDLTLEVGAAGSSFTGGLEYNSDLFDRATIERMAEHFVTLLRAATARPEERVARLPLLSEAERRKLVVHDARAYGSDECIHELFEQQVARAPNAVAVIHGDERLTYAELDERANRLAHLLRARGVGPESLVAFCLERGLEPVVAILGILKAGGAYVPIDPVYPPDRRAYIANDSRARLILTTRQFADSFEGGSTLVLDDDATESALSSQPKASPRVGVVPSNVAYVIYTSGSTGRPKGSVIPHANVIRLMRATEEWYRFGASDCWTVFHSFAFDFSVWEIWGALLYGGRMVVVPYLTSRSPSDFLALLASERVTVLSQTPSAFQQLMAEALSSRDTPSLALRWVIFGGEALDIPGLRPWFERFGDEQPRLVNMYGITETTVHVTYRPLSMQDTSNPGSVIGAPIPDQTLYVLDDEMSPCPLGVRGELYVGGAGASRCYLGRPDLTAARFVPDPFSSRPGARLYRTGDVARRRANGDVEYLGRADFQVKIRGFRIEMGEIEAELGTAPGVRQLTVSASGDASNKRLVAYVVPVAGQTVQIPALKTHLQHRLPDYMVPSAFVVLDALPLTPNGKVDRKALPAPDFSAASEPYVAPGSPLEESLAQVWRDVLKVERVGIHDDFFALGGHSLLATQVVSRIRSLMRFDVPVRALFEAPTIAELAKLLERERAEESATPPLVRREHPAPPAASFAQERLWFLDRLNPGSPAYNLPSVVELRGPLDEAALRRALDELVRRHEVLRTTFSEVDGRAVQVIEPPAGMAYAKHDVSRDGDPQGRTRALLAEEVARSFDLAKGPLVRAVLVRLAESDHVLLVAMHHVVSDAWSIDVVMWRELWAAYSAFASGGASPLADLSLQYADYAVWQREALQGDVLERQVAFWKAHLAGAPPVLDLPTDRPRPAMQTFRGGTIPFAIDAETTARAKELCRRVGATPFMLLLSAFAAVLSRYSGQRDLVIGTPIANRNRAETESVIGFFVNTLPVRIGLEPTTTFEALVRATKETSLAAYAHQDVPFERVVEELGAPRDLSRTPVFQVMFAMQNVAGDAERIRRVGDLEAKLVPPSTTVAKFDLTLALGETDSCFQGGLEYSADLFDRATVERMVGHFVTLLRAAIAHPEERVARLPLMSEAERRRVLVEWNDTRAEYASDKRLHELFEDQARRTPDAIAVEFEDSRLRYGELDERAERMATWLAARGAGRGRRVAISVPRSTDMVAAVLGVLKSGAAYVPIDPRYPEDRKRFMHDDAGCVAELTEATIAEALSAPPANRARERVRPDDLAYVLYTSGSTGRPKGVMVEHRNVVNLVRAMLRDPGMAPTDVELALTTLSFDVAGAEIYVPLAAGARIVVASEETARDPKLLSELIARAGANTAGATPATWRMLVADGWRPGPEMHIHTAGEALPRDLADALLERGATLYNLYGPTETAIYATGTRIESGDAITIGRPILNTATYVLDRDMEPVPAGVVGELYIAGTNVARGYNGRPELTAEKFVPDPFSNKPGARMYATGDLARFRANGTLDYLGRNDHQVKVRGFRIELGEIEAALAARADVRAAVVMAREDTPGDKRLVAYVVAAAGASIDVATLRAELGGALPDYMVPTAFVVLDALPLTATGKVDRKALPAPDPSAAVAEYVAPRDEMEQALAEIFCEVLGVPRVGIHDDFFALGGHSLLATRVVSRIRAQLDIEIRVRALFEASTVARLVERVRAASGGARETPQLVRAPEPLAPTLSFVQEVLAAWETRRSPSDTWNGAMRIDLRGPLDAATLRDAVAATVTEHDVLRWAYDARAGLKVLPASAIPFEELDATGSSDLDVDSLCSARATTPFTFDGSPLTRFLLLRRSSTESVLLFGYHAFVNALSHKQLIFDHVLRQWRSIVERVPPPEPPPVRFTDYVAWERAWYSAGGREEVVAAKKSLEGARPLEIADYPRKGPVSAAAIDDLVALDVGDSARVHDLARALTVSPFTIFVAAAATLLTRWSASDDITLLVPVDLTHRHDALRQVVGTFHNWQTLRISCAGNPSFAELVARARTAVNQARDFDAVPAPLVFDSPHVFDHPLNRVLLSTPNVGPPSASPVLGQVGAVTATEGQLARLKSGARNDLGIGMWSAEGRVYVVLRGAKELFRTETIAARRAELCAMLCALSPDTPISKL